MSTKKYKSAKPKHVNKSKTVIKPTGVNELLEQILNEVENVDKKQKVENKAKIGKKYKQLEKEMKQQQAQALFLKKKKEAQERFNTNLAKDPGLNQRAHDQIVDILKKRIAYGDVGLGGKMDFKLEFLNNRLEHGQYANFYDQSTLPQIQNNILANNYLGIPEILVKAIDMELAISKIIGREDLHLIEAVFKSIIDGKHEYQEYRHQQDLIPRTEDELHDAYTQEEIDELRKQGKLSNNMGGIMDDDYNRGQYGVPGYQYLHQGGYYYQHGGKSNNSYIDFLKSHKGQGYTRKELLSMYRQQNQ